MVAGMGAAVDGAENMRVNSPGAVAGAAAGGIGAVGTLGAAAPGAGTAGAGWGGVSKRGGGIMTGATWEMRRLGGSGEVAAGAAGAWAAGAETAGAGTAGAGTAGAAGSGAGTDGAPNIWVKAPGAGAAAGGGTTGAGTTGAGTTGAAGSGAGTDGAPNICVNAPGAGAAGAGATGVLSVGTASFACGGVASVRKVSCNCSVRGLISSSTTGTENAAGGSAAGAAGADGATGPALANSQPGNDCRPARNSVTIAKPDGSVAVSRMRFLSGPESRLSCTRRRSTSSGPAASARCTMTTRPVANSCALCVRMPSATATHLSRRYRVLKSSLMSRRSVGRASSATTRQPSRRCILQLFTPRWSRATDRARPVCAAVSPVVRPAGPAESLFAPPRLACAMECLLPVVPESCPCR